MRILAHGYLESNKAGPPGGGSRSTVPAIRKTSTPICFSRCTPKRWRAFNAAAETNWAEKCGHYIRRRRLL
jgi:hypothetical protein